MRSFLWLRIPELLEYGQLNKNLLQIMGFKKNLEKVFGDWEIKELLGVGEHGKAYRIEKTEGGIIFQAALKKIEISPADDSGLKVFGHIHEKKELSVQLKKCMERVSLAKKVKGQTNIVDCDDVSVVPRPDRMGWDIYIKMELLTPLAITLKGGPLSEEKVVRLGIDILRAVETFEKAGASQREIRPENIFVSPLGDFKLGDFGIDREPVNASDSVEAKRRYTYIAPEIYKGNPYNPTVEIYAIGTIMYQFLNGNRPPFLPPYSQSITPSDIEIALTKRISEEPIPGPSDGSTELKRIVLKACAYRPGNRYQRAIDMRRELEDLLWDMTSSGENKQKHYSHFYEKSVKTSGNTAHEKGQLDGNYEDESGTWKGSDYSVQKKQYYGTRDEHNYNRSEVFINSDTKEDDDATVGIFGNLSVSPDKTEIGMTLPVAIKYNESYIKVDKDSFALGRDKKVSDLHFDNKMVSAHHAKIIIEGQNCYIVDVNSTNGTCLNDQRIKPNKKYMLKSRDKVKLANEQIEIIIG